MVEGFVFSGSCVVRSCERGTYLDVMSLHALQPLVASDASEKNAQAGCTSREHRSSTTTVIACRHEYSNTIILSFFPPRPAWATLQVILGVWAVSDGEAMTVSVYDPKAVQNLEMTFIYGWWAELGIPPLKSMSISDLRGVAGM